jgi:hypothetical protein
MSSPSANQNTYPYQNDPTWSKSEKAIGSAGAIVQTQSFALLPADFSRKCSRAVCRQGSLFGNRTFHCGPIPKATAELVRRSGSQSLEQSPISWTGDLFTVFYETNTASNRSKHLLKKCEKLEGISAWGRSNRIGS